jgi:hypothetical protein
VVKLCVSTVVLDPPSVPEISLAVSFMGHHSPSMVALSLGLNSLFIACILLMADAGLPCPVTAQDTCSQVSWSVVKNKLPSGV